MDSTSSLTRSKTIRCRIFSSRCCNDSGWKKTALPRPLERCAVWNCGPDSVNRIALKALVFAASAVPLFSAETVIDFEGAIIGKPVPKWVEKGVLFALAHEPKQSKAAGRIMFFPHLATNHKGILCAMATEQIPVQATFPTGASSVTLVLWGSTGCPAVLEAFDKNGNAVDKISVPTVPGRTKPEDPIPTFELKVKAPQIAYIRFSGPRSGEFLAADELRFTPLSDSAH
jgi:hypothetical protein